MLVLSYFSFVLWFLKLSPPVVGASVIIYMSLPSLDPFPFLGVAEQKGGRG